MPDLQGTAAGEVLTSDGFPNNVYGNGGDDLLFGISPYSLGWSGASNLFGGSGSDILISGGGGSGQLLGGDGDDYIADGFGNAALGDPRSIVLAGHIKGGGGHFVDGGDGNDTYFVTFNEPPMLGVEYSTAPVFLSYNAAATQNLIYVGNALQTTLANVENIRIVGGFGSDFLLAGAGDDVLIGNIGADNISGGDGNDVIGGRVGPFGNSGRWAELAFGDSGFDTLNGGAGTDFGLMQYTGTAESIVFDNSNAAAVNSVMVAGVQRATVTSVERLLIQGGSGNDQFIMGNLDDVLSGGAGSDTLTAAGGNDTLSGGDGNDILYGGGGVDTAEYRLGAAVNVSLALAGAQDTGQGLETLVDIENLTGSAWADTLAGNAGDNVLQGLAGDDQLVWSAGSDTLDGGEGFDRVTAATMTAGVAINLALSSSQVIGGAQVTLLNVENLTGSAFNDSLTGDGGANVLDGGLGDDLLDGAGGVDTASYAGAASGVTVDLRLAGAQSTGMGADTLISIEGILGSAFDDVLTGSSSDNTLVGGAGNDRLEAGGGIDRLDGGEGDDYLIVGAGQSTILGGAGSDTVSYERVTAGVAANIAYEYGTPTERFSELEHLIGSGFADTLSGNSFANLIQGGDGDDVINGDWGNDTVQGGAGNDTVQGNVGDDRVDGGDGLDTASYYNAQGPLTISLAIAGPQNTGAGGIDTLVSIENLSASFYDDVLSGNSGANAIFGDGGADVIDGGGGADTLNGSDGIDTATYASSANAVVVDLRIAGSQNTGNGLTTLISIENLTGSAFNDVLMGDDGGNILAGGAGDDTLIGGAGIDRASYATATGGVTVSLDISNAQDVGGGMGVETLLAMEGVIGGAFADVLTGNAGNNMLAGGAGDDLIEGGLGEDTLDGGVGLDTLSYAGATAGVTVNISQIGYRETGGGGRDLLSGFENLIGSGFNDSLTGSSLTNILVGGRGNDSLNGGFGEDQVYGGEGADILRDGGETTNRDFLYGGSGDDTYFVTSSLTGPLDLVYEGGANPDLAAGASDVDTIRSAGEFFWDYYGVGERLYIDRVAGSQLVGGTNDQQLFGGAGSDQIIGYGGTNRVDAGAGTDAISFGLYGLDESHDGVNTLVMKPSNGLDYVYEFESGVDKIDLTAFNFGITGAQVLAQAVNVDQAGTADDYCYFYLTSAGGVDNYVAFIGLLSNQLQAGDFIT